MFLTAHALLATKAGRKKYERGKKKKTWKIGTRLDQHNSRLFLEDHECCVRRVISRGMEGDCARNGREQHSVDERKKK